MSVPGPDDELQYSKKGGLVVTRFINNSFLMSYCQSIVHKILVILYLQLSR